LKEDLRKELKKHRTYYKTFHHGFGKGMTEGDIRNKLGNIKVEIQKWPLDVPIFTRDLKEMLGRCGYYLTGSQITKLSREGFLGGVKIHNCFWIYPKLKLFDWVVYLEEVALYDLIDRGKLKRNKEDEVLIPVRGKKKKNKRIVI